MKRYYEKYKHIIPLAIFGVIYVLWFYLLEHRTNVQYMVVHMNIDDYIPFCEYFVVPYLLWFAYVPAVLGYLFFKDRRNYDRCAVFLCTGMLIFLVISMPPRYLRSTSGTTTLPSARWFCSTMAGKMRDVARPEPLRVWTNSVLPVASRRKRMLPRRA